MKKFFLKEGQKFNRLMVLKLHHTEFKNNCNTDYYLCKCDCGNECIINKKTIVNNWTKSCGCLKKEGTRNKHKLSKSRIYNIYHRIINRCYYKNNGNYKYYGERGIKVCEEWKSDFMNFYNWAINNGYKDNLTIDRINNNGDYKPDNCRWVSMKDQFKNRRSNHYVEYNDKKYSIKELSELLNINYKCLYSRLKRNNFKIDYGK